LLGQPLRRCQNRAIEAAYVIEELIGLARDMHEAERSGENLGRSEDELAYYDALETNYSAVKVLGDETLPGILGVSCRIASTWERSFTTSAPRSKRPTNVSVTSAGAASVAAAARQR
jgi:hypothetical protein